jgi:CheY-like chemotaxis protein
MPAKDGNSVLIGGVAFDITDRIQAEKAALEASRQKDAFFAVLGHELRNPLSPMLTSLQVMRLRGIEGREIEILERQVTHMRRLVDDLLDVSRITSGKVELKLDDVDLGAILVRTLDTVGPLLAQRHHQLHVEIPKGAIGVRADPERLTQIVTNLLVNAAKFSDEGSNIYLEASVSEGFVILSIRDEGIGIAPEMLDTIFDNFVQRPESVDRSRDGLGLGLAVVRSLVRQHGGRVFARSEGRGKGSEFVVELPSVTLHASSLTPPTPVRPRRAVGHRERVLVVDDNRDAAETLHAGLVHYGFEVEVAFEPAAALKLAREFRPSVALLDVGMPDMSGYELATRLRALVEPGGTLRLVAVTGFGQPDDRERAFASGFDRHLVKPVDLKTLLRTLDELRQT